MNRPLSRLTPVQQNFSLVKIKGKHLSGREYNKQLNYIILNANFQAETKTFFKIKKKKNKELEIFKYKKDEIREKYNLPFRHYFMDKNSKFTEEKIENLKL